MDRSWCRVHHSGAFRPMSRLFFTRLTPFTWRVKSAALALCSAFSTVPSNVTTPDSVVTMMPDNPPNSSLASLVSTAFEMVPSRVASFEIDPVTLEHPPETMQRRSHAAQHNLNPCIS